MSMPKFPEINPELTCNQALNMVLVSIAMEELALSHIINAEGEKLQYVLGKLETSHCVKPDIDEVLKINQSITCLLDGVLQNQMILKNKMDKTLQAMKVCPRSTETLCQPKPSFPPCLPGPTDPKGQKSDSVLPGFERESKPADPTGPAGKCPCKCSASFKAERKCKKWCEGPVLHWDTAHLHGKCACLDPCDETKIKLCSEGRFMVHFSVNVRAKKCKHKAAIRLQMIKKHRCKDICSVRSHISCGNEVVTISMGGIIIEKPDDNAWLLLRLESHGSLIIEDAMLSIIEI